MSSKKSTSISLIILGLVSVGVLVYFAIIYLLPPAAAPLVEQHFSTDVKTDIINSKNFDVLEPYVTLPIPIPDKVGRPNPFEPLSNKNSANANDNANTNGNSNSNVPPPPATSGEGPSNLNKGITTP